LDGLAQERGPVAERARRFVPDELAELEDG
jgi:hypothetical protein